MALLGVDKAGSLIVCGVSITSSDQLTCELQKQTWACIQVIGGNSYSEAREAMLDHIQHVTSISRDDSIWHIINQKVNSQ